MRAIWLALGVALFSGCAIVPRPSRQPEVHNPFPQLSKVAVAPFFNSSSDRSVDGRRVALDYYNELQAVPGFEVVPLGVVEAAMQVQRVGSPNAVAGTREILIDTRARLYGLLAADTGAPFGGRPIDQPDEDPSSPDASDQ